MEIFLSFSKFPLDIFRQSGIMSLVDASVAHLVERHLAKVEVASSSLVTRSIFLNPAFPGRIFLMLQISHNLSFSNFFIFLHFPS